ncbi:Vacuolar sorting protein 3 [Camellia lanceoleosa]|uniref:Vacuolar sorting protein 3 n=1 Tax=Camellia lanceoleosa TaxID=1840588 RepID=A0ACC0I1A0_9ERIC|nr:Vacuolar sorting protein 3 [Camellia lanceoleosa]
MISANAMAEVSTSNITSTQEVKGLDKAKGKYSEEQIKDIVLKKNFEEAISLVEELQSEGEMTKEILSFVHGQVGLLLLNRYWGLHPPPSPLENVVDDGLMAIQRAIFLKKAGVETAVDDAFLLNPPNRDDLLQSAIENIIRNFVERLWEFADACLPVCNKEIAAIEASKILEKSSDQDLVLQHIGWIADVDQALAVRVLTSERTD